MTSPDDLNTNALLHAGFTLVVHVQARNNIFLRRVKHARV